MSLNDLVSICTKLSKAFKITGDEATNMASMFAIATSKYDLSMDELTIQA
jgi:hypothetical protein